MSRHFAQFVTYALLLCVSAVVHGQDAERFRDVSGKVVDSHHRAVNGAVVKLENEASDAIMSYVTDADGRFHFKRVSTGDDFKVWATANGETSKKHELSKFSSKAKSFLTLELR